ncbi:MAG: spore coat protein [Bacillota bacterium]|nr:spore coat protein [Bacillota bacterium]
MQLTQKERSLLEDAKKHEELCIQKYNSYSQQAGDPQLKQLFQQHEGQEQNHYNTVNQILQGQQPSSGAGQASQQGGQSMQAQAFQSYQQSQGTQMGQDQSTGYTGLSNQADTVLCTDMLMTEKHVSGAYDTAIFEQTNASVRQALQHIQKQEQKHGEGIFNYMDQHGMYSPK